MYQKYSLILLILIGGFFCSPSFAFAQEVATQAPGAGLIELLKKTLGENSLGEYVQLEASPSVPSPRETVKVSVESSLVDLDKASISWSNNGRTVLSGTGKTTFSFQTGSSGETTRISVSIVTNKGETITKEISFRPLGITLLWEADTYAPPFYRGKALISPQAKVTVVAVPDNGGGQNFSYVWQRDSVNVPEVSGYGKLSYSTEGPRPYKKTSIGVRASSLDDSLKSETEVNLPLSTPFILFYEKNPLLGVSYNKPLGNTFDLSQKEVSLSAEPYFFSNERGEAPGLTYDWSVNGRVVQNYGRTITLRNEAGGVGLSDVSLAMRGINKTFQSATRNLRVNFGEVADTSRPNF
ncbi:MAG: hypothetical protein Q7K40_01775 [bacterium]|nr:hypothetical protein [bacterium]